MLASTTALFAPLLAETSVTVLTLVSSILSVVAVLIGIGYGWRMLTSKVFGSSGSQFVPWYDQPDAKYRRGLRSAINKANRNEYGPRGTLD